VSGLSLWRKLLLWGILIVIIFGGLHYSANNIRQLTPLESAIRDTIAPVKRVIWVAGREIKDFIFLPVKFINLAQRYEQLEKRNKELESKLLQFEEISEENTRLKKLLDFSTGLSPQLETRAASVTGRDYGNWFGSIIINKGTEDGIRQDMAVITPDGLVGRVFNVSRNTAKVLLITDPRSGVGCLVQGTRAPGIVEGVAGGRGQLRMVNIPTDLAPETGDRVITSGLGSVFPKGVPVGYVREVKKEQSGLFNMAGGEPYVDFNRLEEVLVITSFTPEKVEQDTGR